LGTVLVACLGFTAATPFPSYRALVPVLGAVALIWGTGNGTAFGPARALSISPLVFVGAISYSLYLWHLPVFLWAHEHVHSTGLAIVTALGVSLVLSTAAFYLAERPVLRNRFRRPSPAPGDLGPVPARLDVPGQR
jgi:peptidoglycan/LPS O-acetylase OafA/YrhL